MKTPALLLLPLATFAQNPPDARGLLARADESIFTAKTVRLGATQSRSFVGAAPLPGNPFEIEFVRGGRGRAEFRAGNTIVTLMVFDGANLWEYHDLGNQYTKKPATAWIFQGEIATLHFGRNPNNVSAAKYENDETVDFNGRPVACYVIRADYRGAPGNPLGKGVVRRVWISKDSELILRDYWEGSLTPGMGTARETLTTNYTTIETGLPLPDERFVFQPPPGSKLGEPLVVGGVAPGFFAAAPPPPPPPPPGKSADKPMPGTLIRRVAPVYPPEAKRAGIEGVVKVNAVITKDGTVRVLGVLSGPPELTSAATDAVAQWVYQPYIVNGKPVEVMTEILVRFIL
jgi:TonB family protein